MGANLNILVKEWYKANKASNHLVGMLGIAVIRDRLLNNHKTFYLERGMSNRTQHTEEALLELVGNKFKNGLTYPKITIFMANSPCRACTKNLAVWCRAAGDAICKGQSNTASFVFAFSQFYTSGGDKAHAAKMWPDNDANAAAITAYKKVSEAGGTITAFSQSLPREKIAK